jgi:hypothetical protein
MERVYQTFQCYIIITLYTSVGNVFHFALSSKGKYVSKYQSIYFLWLLPERNRINETFSFITIFCSLIIL